MDADADLAALLQRELRGAIERYERAEGARRRARLSRPAARRAQPGARQRAWCGAASRRASSTSSSTSSRTPIRCRRRSCCCSPPTTTAETDWRRVRPRAGPPVPGRRSEAVDLSVPPRRRRHLPRGLRAARRRWARRLLQLTTSFRSVPGDPGVRERRVRAGHDRRRADAAGALRAARSASAGARRAAGDRRAAGARAVRVALRHRGARSSSRCPARSARSSTGSSTRAAGRSPSAAASAPVAVAAKHVCLLFRRFVSWQTDVTRPYVEALEARGIPHVLVGGKAFHEREEVEALRAALAAIEWPDDELSVFATLRGPFFAIGDEELLEWTHRFGRHHRRRASSATRSIRHRVPGDLRRRHAAPRSSICGRSPTRCGC